MAVAEAPEIILTPAEKRRLGALEKRIEAGLQTFREVGFALLEIRDSRLYRETHSAFEDYCREKWNLDKNRAYQFMGAAEVVRVLDNPAELRNEAQARELVPLLSEGADVVRQVWEQVEEMVEMRNTPVTAAIIREARQQVVTPEGPRPPTLTEQVVSSMQRTTDLVRRWGDQRPTRRDKSLVTAAFRKLEEAVTA